MAGFEATIFISWLEIYLFLKKKYLLHLFNHISFDGYKYINPFAQEM